MITGTIKNKVDKIWDDIHAGGLANPLAVIEQLTYLMFIRSLDEKELEKEALESMMGSSVDDKIFPQSDVGQSMRWSKFKNKDSREIYNIISQRVFPALKAMRNGQLPDFAPNGDVILPDLDGQPRNALKKASQTASLEYSVTDGKMNSL